MLGTLGTSPLEPLARNTRPEHPFLSSSPRASSPNQYIRAKVRVDVSVAIDHTIIPSRDRTESAQFYARIFGFEDLGEVPPRNILRSVRVNEETVLFFEDSGEEGLWAKGIHHIAFRLNHSRFEETFARIKSVGVPFGDSHNDRTNMNGPRLAPGAQGSGKSVYFDDPSGNVLQIISY